MDKNDLSVYKFSQNYRCWDDRKIFKGLKSSILTYVDDDAI